jgi:hypothetical protein
MEKEIKELLDERQKLMDKVCFELIDRYAIIFKGSKVIQDEISKDTNIMEERRKQEIYNYRG